MYGVDVFVLVAVKGLPLSVILLVGGLLMRSAGPRARSLYWALGLTTLGLLPLLASGLLSLGTGPLSFPSAWVQSGTGGPSTGSWIVGGWTVGAAFMLIRWARDHWTILGSVRRGVPASDPTALSILQEDREALGIRRDVRLLLSSSCSVPMTYGWRRPVILLPASAVDWPRPRLRAVLRHELSHVARHDFAVAVVTELVRALHWPNPAVWYLAAKLDGAQEMACDETAVQDAMEPADYARQMVEVARSATRGSSRAVAFLSVARASTLQYRVRHVMSLGGSERRGRAGLPSYLLATLALLLTFGIGVADPWRPCPDETSTTTVADAAPPSSRPLAFRSPSVTDLSR